MVFFLSLGFCFPLAPWSDVTGLQRSLGSVGLLGFERCRTRGVERRGESLYPKKELVRQDSPWATSTFFILFYFLKPSELHNSSGILKNGISCTVVWEEGFSLNPITCTRIAVCRTSRGRREELFFFSEGLPRCDNGNLICQELQEH